MNIIWHKRFYKIGLFNIGYKNKFGTPLLRLLSFITMLIDGVLGLILFFTPLIPDYTGRVFRLIIKAQCRKKLNEIDTTKNKLKN